MYNVFQELRMKLLLFNREVKRVITKESLLNVRITIWTIKVHFTLNLQIPFLHFTLYLHTEPERNGKAAFCTILTVQNIFNVGDAPRKFENVGVA